MFVTSAWSVKNKWSNFRHESQIYKNIVHFDCLLTQWCSLYEEASSNNYVAQQENKAFHVVRSTILHK